MVIGKVKKRKISNDGKKRAIQRPSTQKELSKWSQEEKAIYKKISGNCYLRCINTWTS
jgi:hypothetical protein